MLFLYGCIEITFDANQQFNEDGTSTLKIKEYVGLSESLSDSMGSLYGESAADPSSIALMGMMDYYRSASYPAYLCSVMEDEVDECKAGNDGTMDVEVDLKPGEFYTYKQDTDWVNLKEVRTYTIKEVPSASYFAGLAAGDYTSGVQADMAQHIEDNMDKYLEDDAYCTGGYALGCEMLSYSGTSATVRFSSSYSTIQVMWASCTAQDSMDFLFMNESEARTALGSVTSLNRTVASGSPLSLTLACPSGAKSIVMGYRTSSYGTTTASVDAFDIATKADMKEDVLEELNSTLDSSSMLGTDTTSSDYRENVLNFDDSTVFGMGFDELGDLTSGSAAMMNVEVAIDYKASFPNKVLNATVDGEKVTTKNNDVIITLDDLDGLDEGSLVVVTEKEISPLGVFTWLIPVVLLLFVVVLVAFAFAKR